MKPAVMIIPRTEDFTNAPEDAFSNTLEDDPIEVICNRDFPADHWDAWDPVDGIAGQSSLLKHKIWLHLNHGSMYHSPVQPKRVIDVGAGSCTWSIDLADNHPSVHIIAIDRAIAILPKNVPMRLHAWCLDVEETDEELPDEQNADLIFMRQVEWCKDWKKLFYHRFKFMKPGSWIEFHMVTPKPNNKQPAYLEWLRLFGYLKEATGREFPTLDLVKQLFEEIGFSNIMTTTKEWSFKDVQSVLPANYSKEERDVLDTRGLVLRPLNEVLNWHWDSTEILAASMIREERAGMKFESWSVCARKPEE
ncbi:S-adenosyl-L-methionine-dependent methyltransferase [Mariannaea sp. PMI_226]|nr:S-adenosyl-L-methionine-dependent methyltransferase [Mariannaea sp. PMI_226]